MVLQLERLRKDSRELGNYIHQLNQSGKTDLAYKIARKQAFLEDSIMQAETKNTRG